LIVVGNGLLAKEFKKISISKDIVVFASGVSNSKEYEQEPFDREELLLRETIMKYKNKKILYFSTCSISQSSKSPYIEHNIKMENIIIESGVSYYVFRLPQVIGIVDNNTLVSFIVRSSYLNNSLTIQNNAYRNLIDIEDVVRIVKEIILCSTCASVTFNISASSYISVLNLTKKIKGILNSDSLITEVYGGENYKIDNSRLKEYLSDDDIIFTESYPFNLLDKYTSKLVNNFKENWSN